MVNETIVRERSDEVVDVEVGLFAVEDDVELIAVAGECGDGAALAGQSIESRRWRGQKGDVLLQKNVCGFAWSASLRGA